MRPTSDRLLGLATLRALEQSALARLPAGALMARAAQALALRATRIARGLPRALPIEVLVGTGNNGADALLAAIRLRELGYPTIVRHDSAVTNYPEDARAIHRQWASLGGRYESFSGLAEALQRSPVPPLVIDGLFGIGLSRPIRGPLADAIASLNASTAWVLSADIPSGLDSDRGVVLGDDDGIAVRARGTTTFIADKPGLRTGQGPAYAGEIEVADLDLTIPADSDAGQRLDTASVISMVRARQRTSHKGNHGSVLVLGGAAGMQGAAYLAGLAAQAGGAGKTYLACLGGGAFDPAHPQLMSRTFDAAADDVDVLVVGCGLGRSEQASATVRQALLGEQACVLDADALNLLADDPDLSALLAARRAPVVLTPHPLEAARLLRCGTRDVQADRVEAARTLASSTGAVIILKGAGTVIAQAPSQWAINTTGSAALATGGTGDVLAGLVGSLLAQRHEAWSAACLSVWLHGRAGDLWHRDHPQGAGLSAVRLAALLPRAWPGG